MELHGTVGPANTKVTEIAERAGVSRMTVYNHFPTDATLFEACSSHWFAENSPPDPASWACVDDPVPRMQLGLGELYAWYRRSQSMMGNVLRDAAAVPALREIMDVQWSPYMDRVVEVLSAAQGNDGDRRAALRLVADFRAWQLLARLGMSDARAARLAIRMVDGVA